ncbi:hypothetical protein D3C75_969100 [compost metagenome]
MNLAVFTPLPLPHRQDAVVIVPALKFNQFSGPQACSTKCQHYGGITIAPYMLRMLFSGLNQRPDFLPV